MNGNVMTGDVVQNKDNAFIVLTDDGSLETINKHSPLNRLVYGHNLHGLLVAKDTIWRKDDVTLEPHENGDITMTTDADSLRIDASKRPALLDALETALEDDDVQPLLEFYDGLREDMVRQIVVSHFAESLPVTVTEKGWRVGPLLLTWDNEFFYPDHRSRDRRGTVIGRGMSVNAYQTDLSGDGIDSRTVEIGGETRRLTDAEAEFLTKALFAIKQQKR